MTLSNDPQFVVYLAGILLALAFDLIPGLRVRFDKWAPIYKRLFMIGVIALIVGVAFGLSCLNVIAWFVCGVVGIWPAIGLFVMAVLANQGIHGVVAKYQRDKAEQEAVG